MRRGWQFRDGRAVPQGGYGTGQSYASRLSAGLARTAPGAGRDGAAVRWLAQPAWQAAVNAMISD